MASSGNLLTRVLVQRGYLALLERAVLAALVMGLLKAAIIAMDLQILPATTLVSSLLGGVIFTLAILLGGVLSDFKEAERTVGELAGALRRMQRDLAFIGLAPASLAEARKRVHEFSSQLVGDLHDGHRLSLRKVMAPLHALDEIMERELRSPGSPFRTVQVGMATFQRLTERLEIILETTFMRAGYVFAASAIAVVLGALLITPLGGTIAGPSLFAMVTFILVGLYLLVADMDNPFDGAVRIGIRPLEKAVADIAPSAPS